MLVLLDTTVLIDYLRGKPAVERVDALLARGDTPCTLPPPPTPRLRYWPRAIRVTFR